MDAKLLKCLLEVLSQSLGFRCTPTILGHLLDQTPLLGQAHLALGDVAVGLSEILAFFPGMGHGADYARDYPRLT